MIAELSEGFSDAPNGCKKIVVARKPSAFAEYRRNSTRFAIHVSQVERQTLYLQALCLQTPCLQAKTSYHTLNHLYRGLNFIQRDKFVGLMGLVDGARAHYHRLHA